MKNGDGKTSNIKSMTFDELTAHIQGLFNEAHSLKRQAALVVVRAGEALALARQTLPEGLTWVKFQAELGLPRATVNEAVRLHKAVKEEGMSEKELANLGIMETKYRLGIRLRGGKSAARKRRSFVIPQPSKKNVLRVVGTSMRLLQESLELIEREGLDLDAKGMAGLAKLADRLAQLARHAKSQTVAAKG